MLYLFIGTNTLTKRNRLQSLAKQHEAEVVIIQAEDGLPLLEEFSEATLFGEKRIFVVYNGLSRIERDDDGKNIQKLLRSPHIIIIWEDKPDRRKAATSQWLKDPLLKDNIEQFDPPDSHSFIEWVNRRVKELGCSINIDDAHYFQQVVLPEPQSGKFGETPIDMWQMENELKKLCTYVGDGMITRESIDAVVTNTNLVETWDITNALADRNQKKAFVALEQFFEDASITDDKAKTIQLNAALAEQFRTILLVQDMVSLRISDAEILKQTGWKSGRLFVIKKIATKFQPRQVIATLEKLYQLDKELKSSTTPGQVVLSLIATQV